MSTCTAFAVGCGGGHKHAATASTVAATTTIAPTTTTLPPVTYTVKRGDSLSGIARQFGGTIAELIAANHITVQSLIVPGEVLIIPPSMAQPATTTTSAPPTSAVTTTTVVSRPGGPAALVITPAHASSGNVFNLTLTGAKSGESVTFEIDSPDNKKFTGQAHIASATGTVAASYLTTQNNGPGVYTVIATGNQGTSARTTFGVDPP